MWQNSHFAFILKMSFHPPLFQVNQLQGTETIFFAIPVTREYSDLRIISFKLSFFFFLNVTSYLKKKNLLKGRSQSGKMWGKLEWQKNDKA